MDIKNENRNHDFTQLMMVRGLKLLVIAIGTLIFSNVVIQFLSGSITISFFKVGFTFCGIVLLILSFIHFAIYLYSTIKTNQ